jgi:hypothetical protein
MRPLGHEDPRRVDHHEAAVADDPVPVYPGGLHRKGAKRLDRVKVQRG